MIGKHRTDPPHPHPNPIIAKYAAYLEHDAPRLRFIGGPEDGTEIIHLGKRPLRFWEMNGVSPDGRPVIDRYEGDPADEEGLRMLYAGRRVVGKSRHHRQR